MEGSLGGYCQCPQCGRGNPGAEGRAIVSNGQAVVIVDGDAPGAILGPIE